MQCCLLRTLQIFWDTTTTPCVNTLIVPSVILQHEQELYFSIYSFRKQLISFHSSSATLWYRAFHPAFGKEKKKKKNPTENNPHFEHATINAKRCSLILILPIKVKRIVVFSLGNNSGSYLYLPCSKLFKIVTRSFTKTVQTSNNITSSIIQCFRSYFKHCLQYSRLFLG